MVLDVDPTDNALLLQSPYLENGQVLRCEDKIMLVDKDLFRLEGRLDRTVKIEEKRLSLTQMEGLLNSHPWVQRSHLVLLEAPSQQLGAIVELSDYGKQQLAAEEKLSINNGLKAHLLTQFERVTLPRHWLYVDKIQQPEANCCDRKYYSCSTMIKALFP